MQRQHLLRVLTFLRGQIAHQSQAIVAIDGGSALGKTTLAHQLAARLPACVVSMDSYVTPRSERTISPYNPSCFRFDQLTTDLQRLRRGESIWLGEYSHRRGCNDEPTLRAPRPILIVEGALSFKLRTNIPIDASIFVEAAEAVMQAPRHARDQRFGITDDHWHERWPAHYAAYERFVLPERERADMVTTIRLPWCQAYHDSHERAVVHRTPQSCRLSKIANG